MANAAGFIQESIWRDSHWRQLSRSAQALYLQLLSQKELDCAGVLPLQANKWAKGCDELTAEQVWADLEELQRERFVFFDVDTDEAFVRTYMRNSNVVKSPNMRRSAGRSAVLVGSAFIRPLLAAELRATGHQECIDAADEMNPSETVSEPFRNGSDLTLSKPFTEPSGVGVGVGTGVTPVITQVGEGEPPPPICADHPNGTDEPCWRCKRVREYDIACSAKLLQDAEAFAKAEAQRKAEIQEKCQTCFGTGFYEIDAAGTVRRCSHQKVGAR